MRILDAIEKTKQLIQSKAAKIYSKDVVEVIFKHPYCKARFIEEAGLEKRRPAATYLKTLEEIGLLKGVKMGRDHYYINLALVKVLSE